MNTARAYKVLAVCDDEPTCGFCGRTDLQRVVAFEEVETGAILYAGTTCAQTVRLLVVDETGEAKPRTARQILTLAERKARESAIEAALEAAAWSVAWIVDGWRQADGVAGLEELTGWGGGGYELREIAGDRNGCLAVELPRVRTNQARNLILGWARRVYAIRKGKSLANRERLAGELEGWIEARRLSGAATRAA